MRYLITMTVDIQEIGDRRRSRKPQEPMEVPTQERTTSHEKGWPSPLVFGVKEAARLLGVSRTSVYGLLKEGALTPVRLGRRMLFTEEELRALIAKRRK